MFVKNLKYYNNKIACELRLVIPNLKLTIIGYNDQSKSPFLLSNPS